MKQIVRLTEGDIHNIVKESVKRILEYNSFEENIVDKITDDLLNRNPDTNLSKMDFKTFISYVMNTYACSKEIAIEVADEISNKI